MNRLALVIMTLLLLLPSCTSEKYYEALAAQAKLEAEQERTKRERQALLKAIPLYTHSYVDSDGNTHNITLNQQRVGNGGQQKLTGSHNVHIPSPGELAFRYFDRGLSTAERLLPFIFQGWFGGDRNEEKQSYSFGDDATFFMTQGDSSGIDYSLENRENP